MTKSRIRITPGVWFYTFFGLYAPICYVVVEHAKHVSTNTVMRIYEPVLKTKQCLIK